VDVDALLEVCFAAATAVRRALDATEDWGLAGTRPGQYLSDLAADEAALAVLGGAGLAVVSEESGVHDADRALIAVLDPVDGSTNASRGIPWFATSVCIVDGDGPLAAAVVNQATGERFWASRGGGAFGDRGPLAPSGVTTLAGSVVALSGLTEHLGWRQFRALGACALDLCAVAGGRIDAYVDATRPAAHAPWDYLGGWLICQESGAVTADAGGAELAVHGHGDRRSPVAAATPALLYEIFCKIG
jgi:fructose-1,6-bisphosphatase/inositol monophosphatase family enzyme